MDRKNVKVLFVGVMLSASVYVTSCKSKPKDTGSTVDTSAIVPAPTTTAPAPVVIAADDSLTRGAKDATKDYPGVTATTSNGEITLTGQIQRSRLPKLMETLHSLRPKKINNQLTIK